MSKLKGGAGRGGRSPHWEVELDVVKNCSKGQSKKVVWVGRMAKLKIDILMKKFRDQEWFAYLLGEDNKIKDIFLPEQSASSAFVGDIECEEYNKLPVIGAMHSHHGMNIDMTGHDHEFVNANHDISLLVNSKGISGQVRVKVPCGALFITEADVRLDLEVDFDKKGFMTEIEEKINKKRELERQEKEKQRQENLGPQNFNRTFPRHHKDCTCVPCQKDRRDWLNRTSHSGSAKTTWDTGEEPGLNPGDVEFEGAWICEECSRINYFTNGERPEKPECAWCESPPSGEELTIDDIDEELTELENMLEGKIELSSEMFKAMEEKKDEVIKELSDEKVLDNAISMVAKFLVMSKHVYGEDERYKNDTDTFIGMLSSDWDEDENSLRDSIQTAIEVLDEKMKVLIDMRKTKAEEETEETEEENSEK